MSEDPAARPNRAPAWAWLSASALAVDCAWLAACHLRGRFGAPFVAALLLHLLLGVVVCIPLALWWRRQRRARPGWTVTTACLLLAASALVGLALAWQGNRGATRPLLWIHGGLAAIGALVLTALLAVAGGQGPPRRRRQLWAAAAAAVTVALSVASLARRAGPPAPAPGFVNPEPPASFAGEAMGGAAGPFYPSALHTRSGGRLAAARLPEAASCGRTGCHPAEVAEWSASAHRHAGFENPWYRAGLEEFRRQAGATATRWCAGCHTPVLLAAGMLDRPPAEAAAAPGDTGVTCAVCHGISRVRSSQGQADFELDPPAADDLAAAGGARGGWRRALQDLALRLDPEPHRRAWSRPPLAAGAANELCAACHKAHVEGPLNGGGHFVEVMNDYEPWQSNSFSGQSMTQSIYFPPPRGCVDCHMPAPPPGTGPRVAALSHRFAAANTALPALFGDGAQLAAVDAALRAAQFSLDFFALGKGRPLGEARGRTSMVPPETVYAPLDRVPATVRRGESNRLDLVLRNRGVGHRFPAGKYLSAECWVELRAVDEHGRVLLASGGMDTRGAVDASAHRLGGLWLDPRGQPVGDGRFWTDHATVFVNWLEPDASHVVHFRLDVPGAVGDRIRVEARLDYRKFAPRPGLPVGPVTTLATAAITLPVAGEGAPLPDMAHPRGLTERDRERWNDYAFALANQADYLAARQALEGLLAVWPSYADGWTTLGNLDWAIGEMKPARAELERALTLAPSLARAHFYLGLVEQNAGNHERALAQLRLAAARYPREALVWKEIGHSSLAAAHYRDAAEALARSLAIDPQDASVQLLMAQAQQALGRRDLAERHMNLYRRFRPDRAAAAMGRAWFEEHIDDVGKERLARHEHAPAPPAAGAAGGGGR